jgi:hypothetical protein
VELVQVDPLDVEPPKRGFAFRADAIGMKVSLRDLHPIGVVPLQTAFREDERSVLCGQRLQKTSDHDL